MASLRLKNVSKTYSGGVKAISDFSVEITDGEFIVIAGSEGSGKSTLLKMIAGLEEVSSGQIIMDGKLINDLGPKDRDMAMIFQDFELRKDLNIFDNLAIGLKERKYPPAEIFERVAEAAEILGLDEVLNLMPKDVPAGLLRKAALGRVIVRRPKVFLLDEPLRGLDGRARLELRSEIAKLHNRLGITFVYAATDAVEALTMGTRIVVLNDGRAEQADTPQNLYDNPCNIFTATYFGSPQMNLIPAFLSGKEGSLKVSFGAATIELPEAKSRRLLDYSYIGKEVFLGVRPEDIHDEEIFLSASPKTIFSAQVDAIERLGNEIILYTEIDGADGYIISKVDARSGIRAGDVVRLAIDSNRVHIFDKDNETAVAGMPKYNFFEARADKTAVTFGDINIAASKKLPAEVLVGIAPDSFTIDLIEDDMLSIPAEIAFFEDMQAYKTVYLKSPCKNGLIAVKTQNSYKAKSGTKVDLYFKPEDAKIFDINGFLL